MSTMNQVPNHRRRIRTYTIISRIFTPIGIAALIVGIILLAVSIPNLAVILDRIANETECVQNGGTRITCDVHASEAIGLAVAYTGLSFGIVHVLLGIPSLVIGIVFHSRAEANRAEDIASGAAPYDVHDVNQN